VLAPWACAHGGYGDLVHSAGAPAAAMPVGFRSAAAPSRMCGGMRARAARQARPRRSGAAAAAERCVPARAQGVWASKYNARALLSMRKAGLDFRDLRMAVLVQRVVPAAYAFVIHTRNPATSAPDEARANPTLHQASSYPAAAAPPALKPLGLCPTTVGCL
jgi:hypothetical protein